MDSMFHKGTIFIFAALFAITMSFIACGDDDSSSFVEPEKESSSSEILSCGDGTSDGNGDKSSSSVSSSSTNSSSSAKSSSSTDSKSSGGDSSPASSSVKSSSSGTSAGTNSSSSLKTCPPEKEGKTRTIVDSGEKQICQNGYWVPMESSSSADVSSSSYFDMTNQFNEKVSYGEFTDPRDGQKYRTVSLKDGVYYTDSLVFFAENLNFGKIISGGAVQGDSTKYCYDDDPWYCENGWGGLYTWSRAMDLPSVCDSVELGSEKCNYIFARDKDGKLIDGEIIHQGLCPEGWHIANDGEWAYLQEKSGNSVAHYMGSMVAGFGNNDYGLSILPTGYWEWFPDGTSIFKNIKKQTLFWLPQQDADNADYAKHVNIMSSDMTRGHSRSKYKYAHSIRCVKNY